MPAKKGSLVRWGEGAFIVSSNHSSYICICSFLFLSIISYDVDIATSTTPAHGPGAYLAVVIGVRTNVTPVGAAWANANARARTSSRSAFVSVVSIFDTAACVGVAFIAVGLPLLGLPHGLAYAEAG